MLDSVLATEKTTKRAHKTHTIGVGEKVEITDYSSYSSLPSGHNIIHNDMYTCNCKCLR